MVSSSMKLSLSDVAHACILFCLSAIFPVGNLFLLKGVVPRLIMFIVGKKLTSLVV